MDQLLRGGGGSQEGRPLPRLRPVRGTAGEHAPPGEQVRRVPRVPRVLLGHLDLEDPCAQTVLIPSGGQARTTTWPPKRAESILPRRIKTPEELLADRYAIDPATGCWIWKGKPKDTGYGQVKIGGRNGRVVDAHQAVYELVVGPVPSGKELDHLCRTPLCVNPAHLEPVTHRVNVLRGESPAARASRATACPQGHPYDAQNTYVRPDGRGRGCRACRAEHDANRRR